ncbi:MAG: hypothetical protein ABI446_06690, partial [Gemmatimonadaceae bacterium]
AKATKKKVAAKKSVAKKQSMKKSSARKVASTRPAPARAASAPLAASALDLTGIAVAQGITTSVIQTWNPVLARTPRVLVPIELSVLMVRDPGGAWAKCGMDAPSADADGAVLTSTLKPPPFADLDAPRTRGAYLHWYLPNGLTSGITDNAANITTFPAIPDRWLVLRLSGSARTARRAVRGWILEAGGADAIVHDLAGWTEADAAPTVINSLTALGHGDLAWAGYFDNVENRLGFHDSTLDADAVQGPISYVTCGWYSDPSLDPLGHAQITSFAAFSATMQRLGWAIDTGALPMVMQRAQDYIAAAAQIDLTTVAHANLAAASEQRMRAWWPVGCLLHGSVVGISWPEAGDVVEVGGPPDPATINVAIGTTMGETLGALVARANGNPGEAAIVEALQLGIIRDLDAPDGRARLDAQLHASGFIALSGGEPTTEPVTIAPSGPAPVSGAPVATSTPTASTTTARSIASHGSAIGGLHASGVVNVAAGRAAMLHGDINVLAGGLREAVASLGAGVTVPPTDPGGEVDAMRAPPRFYLPKDPVLLVQGAKRAFVHDSSVFTEDGIVQCRLSPVTALSWTVSGLPSRLAVRSADILASGVDNGSVPLECQSLLGETALLDPGAAPAIVAAVGASIPANRAQLARRNVTVEQTAWYAMRDPRMDHGPLLSHSGIEGMLPAPFAIAPAARPWTPLHLDWTVEYVVSPRDMDDWQLGEVDFAMASDAQIPLAGNGTTLSGQSTLTGGASATMASAVRNAIAQNANVAGTGPIPPHMIEAFFSPLAQQLTTRVQGLTLSASTGASPLADVATALSQMDVLSCGLDTLHTQLRGGIAGDGSVTGPVTPEPVPFFALRGGFLRVLRLRLVDGYGQYVDLCSSDATHTAQGILVSGPLSAAGDASVAALPPRFTAVTRATLRFMSASEDTKEADATTTPVCGFLMPNHLDGSLELFDAAGEGEGTLQPRDDGRVIWQDTPGTPTTAGQDPAASITNAHAGALARSLVDWGIADANESREPALQALLRTIDSTRWAVDPYAHAGDEHLSLLLGHPVCVLRAMLRLDVVDPVHTADNMVTPVPVRLGALAQWQDGLFGYFANDDYTVLHVSDAAASGMARPIGPGEGFLQPINSVPEYYDGFADDLSAPGATSGATPVSHPYIDGAGTIWIRPNQTIMLTLLVEPMTTVHATMGLVPRKEIGMRREWVQPGLAAIAPTFQFGPVLVDPKNIRMPLATDLNGTWVWDYRADATTWTEDDATNATDDALMSRDPASAIEGWLRLVPPKPATS